VERTDTHTHTYLSNHGDGTVEEVVAAAAARGITTLALTEHLPLPHEADPTGTFAMDADKVEWYLAAIVAAREAHPGLEIITGVEVDWRAGAEQYILDRLAPFELVLGSVHMLGDDVIGYWEFDHPNLVDGWYERGEESVWREYCETWIQAVLSSVPFNIMSHPDLPKKLGFKPTFDARELYANMAHAAALGDVMVEVNTSGLRKPVGELYPGPALLKAFCAAGVPCTVGSDAHTPTDVGRDLEAAYTAMRAAGYTTVTVPTRTGDRREVPLG
jgi:histidinol-phosphatase (PHP family)